jgi:hypothetical protein
MAKGWKCARCSTANDEGAITCTSCGLIRGGVVVPSVYAPAPPSTAPEAAALEPPPSVEAPSTIDPVAAGEPTWWVQPSAAPSAPIPLWRRVPLRLAIVVVVLVAGGIGGVIFNASRSSTGEITRGGDLTANDLRVGDCFDLKDPAAETIGDVTARPCTDEHEFEMFYVDSMPAGGTYPEEVVFTNFIRDKCTPAFTTYIGRAYADSELDYYWLAPTSEAWADGDRIIECAAFHPRVHRLTHSLKGSNR